MNPVYRSDTRDHTFPDNLKVLIVDSRACQLHSLAQSMASTSGIEVSTAGSVLEGRAKCRIDFDVVLFCVGGFSAETAQVDLEMLVDDFKHCRVVVVSEQQQDHYINLADANIIAGIVPASYTTLQLLKCLSLVQSGVCFIPAEYRQSQQAESTVTPSINAGKLAEKLTPRQLLVVEYVSHGKSNKYIAAELCLSESTVKVHVHELMKRLGATSRTHASYIVSRFYQPEPEVGLDSLVISLPQRDNVAHAT